METPSAALRGRMSSSLRAAKTSSSDRRHESKLLVISAIDCAEWEPAVTRTNMLYLVIGALAVAVAVLGYQLYQARHQPEGVHIELGPGGLSIEGNRSK